MTIRHALECTRAIFMSGRNLHKVKLKMLQGAETPYDESTIRLALEKYASGVTHVKFIAEGFEKKPTQFEARSYDRPEYEAHLNCTVPTSWPRWTEFYIRAYFGKVAPMILLSSL